MDVEVIVHEGELKVLGEAIVDMTEKLRSLLLELDEKADKTNKLDQLKGKAKAVIDRTRELAVKKRETDAVIQQADAALKTRKQRRAHREAELKLWHEEWSAALGATRIPADSSPEQASAVLEKISELADNLRQIGDRQSRVQAIESDHERFREGVANLCTLLTRSVAPYRP